MAPAVLNGARWHITTSPTYNFARWMRANPPRQSPARKRNGKTPPSRPPMARPAHLREETKRSASTDTVMKTGMREMRVGKDQPTHFGTKSDKSFSGASV